MGRNLVDKKERREQIYSSAPKYVIEYLGQKECKRIADEAVIKEYEKSLKNKVK